jgi:hypothetical protein
MSKADDDRRFLVRNLWRIRQSPEQRTAKDLLMFYGWLQVNRRDLLKHHSDAYRQLKVDLLGEWQD